MDFDTKCLGLWLTRVQREAMTTHPLNQRGCDPFRIAHGSVTEMQVAYGFHGRRRWSKRRPAVRPPSMLSCIIGAYRTCRRVTLIWVYFLGVNGVVAYYTACCTCSYAIWSLYNGLFTYVGIGLLFVVELSYRSWRFRRYTGLSTDFIFKKLFPPKA